MRCSGAAVARLLRACSGMRLICELLAAAVAALAGRTWERDASVGGSWVLHGLVDGWSASGPGSGAAAAHYQYTGMAGLHVAQVWKGGLARSVVVRHGPRITS